MDPIDLRPLEFARGQEIVWEMISHMPGLHPVQREMMGVFIRQPRDFFVEDNGFVDPIEENLSNIKQWMFSAFQSAPQILLDRFQDLYRTARRFGTWDELLLKPESGNEMGDVERHEYGPAPESVWIAKMRNELSAFMTVGHLDSELVPKLIERITSIMLEEKKPDEKFRGHAIVDLDADYFILGPSSFTMKYEADELMPSIDVFDPYRDEHLPLYQFRLQSEEDNRLNINMRRSNAAFDPLEPYARRVKIFYNAILGDDCIAVVVDKDLRPSDEPLLYEFSPMAKRWASLPQDVPLWRVEATVSKEIKDPSRVMDMMSFVSNPAVWKAKDPPHIFVQSARYFHNTRYLSSMRDKGMHSLVEDEIRPGRSLGILCTGEHAPEVLGMLRNAVNGRALRRDSTGGGASSTRCRISNVPRMVGMGPGAMALTSGLMAARLAR